MAKKPLDAPTDLQVHVRELTEKLGKMGPGVVTQAWPILTKIAEDVKTVETTWNNLVRLVGNLKEAKDHGDRLVVNLTRALGCILKKQGGSVVVDKALFDGWKKGTEVAADHDADGNLVVRMREPEEKSVEEEGADA